MKICTPLLLLMLCLFRTNSWSQDKDFYPKGIKHVVVIGIDGLSPNGIRKANTPVMHQMIAEGAIKWNVRTVLPSSSSPNWASMIMGAGVEAHGVLDNDWEKEDASLPPVVAGASGLFPTIFSVIRSAKPNAEIGAIYHWDGFGRLVEQESLSYHEAAATEDAATVDFISYLKNKKPDFAFLQLDHVDGAGHESGHGTAAYFKAVQKADSLVGLILAGLKQASLLESTLVIITADHGGVGYGHGGATPAESEIAMIFFGKAVKSGYQVQQQVYTYDLAASIAFALNIVPPYAWTGRPVKSAFAGFGEPLNLWKGKEVLPSPVIQPEKYLFAQAGGLYVDKTAMVKIDAADKTEVRYTTDGAKPSRSSAIYTAPFPLTQTAVVKAASFNQAGNESLTATAYFRLVKSHHGNGLKMKFYNGSKWTRLPDFNELTPAKSWESFEFNLNREQVQPLLAEGNNTFATSFDGYLQIDEDGEYTFYTQSDDGSQLWLDGQKIVDNNESHGVIERSGKVYLKKGRHAIKVLYFNDMGGFWLDVFYSGNGLTKQIIPANKLFLKDK